MYKLEYLKHVSNFISPGGTSRGVLYDKPSWILKLTNLETSTCGYGEISIIPGLSIEDESTVTAMLSWLQANINQPKAYILDYLLLCPAVFFGVECAFLDLEQGGKQIWFPSAFTKGEKSIHINGLVWMNAFDTMKNELDKKLNEGATCIKIKIGSIDIKEELKLVAYARSRSKDLVIRLDANGAFPPNEVLFILETFAAYNIHSVEQPIKAGQPNEMQKVAAKSPIPVALDEELIGIHNPLEKQELLQTIRPQYIILKPSLVGGFRGSENWISLAENLNINWWATSALETNLGLNAISQWVGNKNTTLAQGLGTGKVFSNNFETPLELHEQQLRFNPNKSSKLPF